MITWGDGDNRYEYTPGYYLHEKWTKHGWQTVTCVYGSTADYIYQSLNEGLP